MATLAQTYMSMADLMKATEDGKKIATVIELLNQANGPTQDFMATECNMGAVHRHTIRTGLPTGAWGQLYKGVAQSKSSRQQIDDTTGFYEQLFHIDKRLLDLAVDKSALKMSEAYAHIEAMNQEIASGFFYHSTASAPEKFQGMGARYSSVSSGDTAQNVIDAGGTGSDNTSMWLVTHGANDTCVLYPKGTQAGLKMEDKGEQPQTDSAGNRYYGDEVLFTWHFGVAVKDWRNNARICNIDVSNMQAGSVDLYKFLRKAYYKLNIRRTNKIDNQLGTGRTVIYCNRDVMEALDGLATNQGASDNFTRLRPMEIEGKEVMTYRGIPIRETDALLNTEARIT